VDKFLTWLLPNVGPLLTAVGLFFTVWALRANHDWNRRNFSATLVVPWNDKTSARRKAIEFLRLGLVDLDKSGDVVELTKKDATAIYVSKPANGGSEWELRFHFIELLNYFESIAVAYTNAVGDQSIIEDSVRNPLIGWHDILQNFIQVVAEHRGYQPWEPYTALVAHWKRKPFKRRRPTA
jgi:hypothetical protein